MEVDLGGSIIMIGFINRSFLRSKSGNGWIFSQHHRLFGAIVFAFAFLLCLGEGKTYANTMDSISLSVEGLSPEEQNSKLVSLYRSYLKKDPRISQSICTYRMRLAEQRGDSVKLSDALNDLGVVHKYLGQFDSSIHYLEEALRVRVAAGELEKAAGTLNNLGVLSKIAGDYDPAISYYSESLAIKRKLGDSVGVAKTLSNIGLVYERMGKFEKALHASLSSLRIKNEVGDSAGMAVTQINTGLIFQRLDNHAKALDYFTNSLALHESLGNLNGIGIALNNIGNSYLALDRSEDALRVLNRSLEIRLKNGRKTRHWVKPGEPESSLCAAGKFKRGAAVCARSH